MLPTALLDLTLLRVSFNPHTFFHAGRQVGARTMHQAVQRTPPPPPPLPYEFSFARRGGKEANRTDGWPPFQEAGGNLIPKSQSVASGTALELARRVQALEAAATTEASAVEELTLTEDQLLGLYEDLLALPPDIDIAPTGEDLDADIGEDKVSKLMAMHADNGDITAIENVMSTHLTGFPTERQRHLHIKTHLNAAPPSTIPTSALEVLHSYESQSHPAAMRTYTSVITSLFSTKSSVGRAQAWDLFAHMRYVAHPYPDVPLYTLMIRACASPINAARVSSEPERALDLWTEMTMDKRMRPSAGAYDAVILACARSGRKIYVNEGFRLAREMLDSHRDARGDSAYRPSRRTFCALLEGAKRVGDLTRARWILAQMIAGRGGMKQEQEEEVEGVNEEVMMHIFHAYAAYRPPFQRSAVRPATDDSTATEQHNNGTVVSQSVNSPEEKLKDIEKAPLDSPSFMHIPPQSHHEVIIEAKTLFGRILHDSGRKIQPDSFPEDDVLPAGGKFKGVNLTPRLLNSYLSVHYKHAAITASRNLYRSVFGECGVERTARAYMEALERCANSKKHGEERVIALEFAEEVWAQWKTLEDPGIDCDARVIERARIAMIRMLTLTGNVDRAVQHVREFAAHYPPSDVASPSIDAKPAFRATRTVLVGQRPLVRMTSSTEVPDDHVPPLLMFRDLEVLHHRLVAREATKEIAYLKYLTKAYEWALRRRRDEVMKAKPEKDKISLSPQVAVG